MNVWILQTGEPLPTDEGSVRPMRAINLANSLIRNNSNVTLWSSAFFHQNKIHRATKNKTILVNENLVVKLLYSPGYKKNIGVERLLDHALLAFNLYKTLKHYDGPKPNIIFIGFPPIETSFIMARWAKKNNIPFIIDAKDKWPAIFLEPFDARLRTFITAILWPYFYMTRFAFKKAKAFCSMSESYICWMKSFSKQPEKLDIIAPLVSPPMRITVEEEKNAEGWWMSIGVSLKHSKRFVFVGSISRAFDFNPIIDVARQFKNDGIFCEFVICGSGEKLEELKKLCIGLPNIIFPGWIDSPQIAQISKFSLASLAPYRNLDNFTDNIPNKIIDSLSNSLPIITPLNGEVNNLIEKYKLGFHYKNSQELYDICIGLLNMPKKSKLTGIAAQKCYNDKFEFYTVYRNLSSFLEELTNVQ